MTLLDQVLPRWHYRSQHALAVPAPAAEALAAARAVGVRDSLVVRVLLGLRGLPTPDATIEAALLAAGFAVVAEEPGRELVLAAVGRPWRPLDRLRRDVDARTFDEPGWARMALSLSAVDGWLRSETRVLLTDEEARRRFARYWLLVKPFSGLVRRRWLALAGSAIDTSRVASDDARADS